MFIGEAPGRLGADSSSIPFHGDKAGHNFETLLSTAGLDRSMVFVTNAVLCNPKDEKGNNSPPSIAEIENCSAYLKQQVDIVSPRIVVTLGANALRAVALIDAHTWSLRNSVRTAKNWYGRILIPIYHPGQRAMLHRSYANQQSDYQFVAEQLARLEKGVRKVHGKTKPDVAAVACAMLKAAPNLSYFALHKLFYLLEFRHVTKYGEQLTKAFFVRQKDGPYCVDLHPAKLRKALPNFDWNEKANGIGLRNSQRDLFVNEPQEPLPGEVLEEISYTLKKYGALKPAALKTRVYLTSPMRRILREERTTSVSLYNAPIDLKVQQEPRS
jgi:uracil-DNA glycosylase family 4